MSTRDQESPDTTEEEYFTLNDAFDGDVGEIVGGMIRDDEISADFRPLSAALDSVAEVSAYDPRSPQRQARVHELLEPARIPTHLGSDTIDTLTWRRDGEDIPVGDLSPFDVLILCAALHIEATLIEWSKDSLSEPTERIPNGFGLHLAAYNLGDAAARILIDHGRFTQREVLVEGWRGSQPIAPLRG